MKKLLIFAICIYLSFFSYSQLPTLVWYEAVNTDTIFEPICAAINHNGTGTVGGWVWPDTGNQNYLGGLFWECFDSTGTQTLKSVHDGEYTDAVEGICMTDDNIYLAGEVSDSTEIRWISQNGFLAKFSSDGDSLWSITLKMMPDGVAYAGVSTLDNHNYLFHAMVMGEMVLGPDTLDAPTWSTLLATISEDGEILNHQIIPYKIRKYMKQSNGSSYCIGGYDSTLFSGMDTIAPVNGSYINVLFKLNTWGNLIWAHPFGIVATGWTYTGFEQSGAFLYVNNISTWGTGFYFDSTVYNNSFAPSIITFCIDTNGIFQWVTFDSLYSFYHYGGAIAKDIYGNVYRATIMDGKTAIIKYGLNSNQVYIYKESAFAGSYPTAMAINDEGKMLLASVSFRAVYDLHFPVSISEAEIDDCPLPSVTLITHGESSNLNYCYERIWVYDLLGHLAFSSADCANSFTPRSSGIYLYQIVCTNGARKNGKIEDSSTIRL